MLAKSVYRHFDLVNLFQNRRVGILIDLQRRDALQHVFSARRLGTRVAGGIIRRFTDVNHLDHAVFNEHGKSFASPRPENRARTRVRKLQIQRSGHHRVGVP